MFVWGSRIALVRQLGALCWECDTTWRGSFQWSHSKFLGCHDLCVLFSIWFFRCSYHDRCLSVCCAYASHCCCTSVEASSSDELNLVYNNLNDFAVVQAHNRTIQMPSLCFVANIYCKHRLTGLVFSYGSSIFLYHWLWYVWLLFWFFLRPLDLLQDLVTVNLCKKNSFTMSLLAYICWRGISQSEICVGKFRPNA